jgi:hypothetical protein
LPELRNQPLPLPFQYEHKPEMPQNIKLTLKGFDIFYTYLIQLSKYMFYMQDIPRLFPQDQTVWGCILELPLSHLHQCMPPQMDETLHDIWQLKQEKN